MLYINNECTIIFLCWSDCNRFDWFILLNDNPQIMTDV